MDGRRLTGLRNGDGDVLLLTIDEFVMIGTRAAVERALSGIAGVDQDDDLVRGPGFSDGTMRYVALGESEHTAAEGSIHGRIEVSGRRLRILTNSVRRADALRARVERAVGLARLKHVARRHLDLAGPDADAGEVEAEA
jgi:hypothetical protein